MLNVSAVIALDFILLTVPVFLKPEPESQLSGERA